MPAPNEEDSLRRCRVRGHSARHAVSDRSSMETWGDVQESASLRRGLMANQIIAPARIVTAATSKARTQPNFRARNGVRIGDRIPPTLPPQFITPLIVPAYLREISMVVAQCE